MVDIRVGLIAPVKNNHHSGGNQQQSLFLKKKKQKDKERRKNKLDRRQSVRDGVVVTLSTQSDRRGKTDRRKN